MDQGDHSPRPPTDPDLRDFALPAPLITGSLRDDKSNEQREPTATEATEAELDPSFARSNQPPDMDLSSCETMSPLGFALIFATIIPSKITPSATPS